METEQVYQDDAYRAELTATLLRIEDGLVFDHVNFFASGGGQPGDTGTVVTADGLEIAIVDTAYTADRSAIRLIPAEGASLPSVGDTVTLKLDWERRHRLMRMHTACHLLTVACPYPVTGASVGELESRIDFDIPDVQADKAAVTDALMALVDANHPVFTRWITDAELDADPGLIKSANVKPPRGSGRIRLVCIGPDGSVDTQPCGGTHVAATGEIGAVHVGKIEKKGKANRRFRIRFGPLPAQ